MKFTLHEFIRGGIDRLVMKSSKSGGYTTARITFLPDTVYEVEDQVTIDYLLGKIGDVRQKSIMTPSLREELDDAGVVYEVTKCGTCPSAKPKAVYNPFKVVEE